MALTAAAPQEAQAQTSQGDTSISHVSKEMPTAPRAAGAEYTMPTPDASSAQTLSTEGDAPDASQEVVLPNSEVEAREALEKARLRLQQHTLVQRHEK